MFLILLCDFVVGVKERLVALGDLHGDCDRLDEMLQLAGLLNPEHHWQSSKEIKTTLIQLGDLIDRGPGDFCVLRRMKQLRSEAEAKGDRIINLLGNHEHMNLIGDHRYIHPDAFKDFGGMKARIRAFQPGGENWNEFYTNFSIIFRHKRHVFVHGGIWPEVAALGPNALNQRFKQAMDQATATVADEPLQDWIRPLMDSLINSLLWDRQLVTDSRNGNCSSLRRSLALLRADVLVVGHTPQRDGRIRSFCNDRLVAVDVGLSRWMFNSASALEISIMEDGTVIHRELPRERSSAYHRVLNKGTESDL